MKKGFNASRFEKAKFKTRTEEVEIPLMQAFFPEGEQPIFKIRSLSSDEVARTNEAIKATKVAESLIEALASMNQKGMAKAVKEQLGYGEEVNGDVQRRIEVIIYGTVEPGLPRELVVKIGEVFPTAFYKLSNRIIEITGLGQVLGKPKPSGKTKESKPA